MKIPQVRWLVAVAVPGTLLCQSPDSSAARLKSVLRDSVPAIMQRMGVPGAVVTIVAGDRVLVNDGFGVSRVDGGTVVDPERTVFRIASVSKVFTSLAALRLAAAGRLDLSSDANRWVPELGGSGTRRGPITVGDLLTHTSGLDDPTIGYLDPVGGAPPTLTALVHDRFPAQGRAPEHAPGYSNYGYALAALVVERITRIPFDQYLRDSIAAPLGMAHTAFVMRPEGDTAHTLEYRASGDIRVQRSSRPYPAGNVGTTGADMAAFLRYILAGTDSASRWVTLPAFHYHPELPPIGYALAQDRIAGRTAWVKGGASPSHSAVLAIIPELHVGIFIALNRQEPLFWEALLPQVVATFGLVTASEPSRGAAPIDASGDYLWTRAPNNTVEKLLGLAAQVRVRQLGDSLLVSGGMLEGAYRRSGALRFRNAAGREIAFRAGSTGVADRLFSIEQGQPISFERIPPSRTTRVQVAVLTGASIFALGAGILTLARRQPDQPGWARGTSFALPILQLATIGSSVVLAAQGDRILEGPTPALYTTLTLSTLMAAAGLAGTAGNATLAGRSSSFAAKVTYAAGAGAGVGLTWFLATNNLIGFRF